MKMFINLSIKIYIVYDVPMNRTYIKHVELKIMSRVMCRRISFMTLTVYASYFNNDNKNINNHNNNNKKIVNK